MGRSWIRLKMPYSFGFVDQGVANLSKVKDYSNAGMDTVLSVANDMLEFEQALGGTVDTTDMVRMLDIMQDFCKMEEEIDVVIKSVDAVKQEARGEDKLQLSDVFKS